LEEIHHYVEAHLSTKQQTPGEDPRISRQDGQQEWPLGAQETAGKRSQAAYSCTLLKLHCALCMRNHLRDSGEFQHVYRNGKRYDGVFITVFVVENEALNHRLGVTASKKALGKAVQRNRAKRLLRETFRSNEPSLRTLTKNYDWVLNAKSAVLSQKMDAPRQEFEGIIEKVGRLEQRESVR
jgi:ribonuclease P protein component